jgi:hypothetical protein
VIWTSCDEETPNEPTPQDYPDYYPAGIGSTYKYSVTEKDSAGNIIQTGSRNVFYSGVSNFRGREYTAQEDSLDFGTQSSVATYLFRKTDTGVFYAVDTSQISQLVPDTLKQYVNISDEMQLLFYPLTTGSSWSLYRVTAEVQAGVEIKILDIIASFDAAEQIDLNLITGTINVIAQKIRYSVELYTEIGAEPERYTSYMWYVENIGLVKFEGNQFIIDFSGGGININITENILTQELTEYYPAELF